MATVAAGGRVTLHGTRQTVLLRVLRRVELTGGWSVAVLADAAALEAAGVPDAACSADLATVDAGTVRMSVRLDRTDSGLLLREPGLSTAALTEQRRDDVRAGVELELRGTLLKGSLEESLNSSLNSSLQDVSAPLLQGRTVTVSAGGLSVRLEGPAPAAGAQLYLELQMPEGDLAPTVMDVVEVEDGEVRGRFVDISPRDRERLVRLVFARQRVELAERRRSNPR